MKYLDEYRDGELTRKLLGEIEQLVTRPWKLMEVCGGQTHSIIKSGLDQLLPPEIDLVHGPGCPVCVTPLELIDKAIAMEPENGLFIYGRGRVHLLAGDREKAMADFKKAAELDDEDAQAYMEAMPQAE